VWISEETDFRAFELDEIFWFIAERQSKEYGINRYIMTMISREPRQIVAFGVENSKAQAVIQGMVDSVGAAERYYTDGYYGYSEIAFPGYHERNERDKSDTHLVESINSDLRHYIPGLRRRSKIFYRSLETLRAVLSVFVDAYNRYGEKKRLYKARRPEAQRWNLPFSLFDFI
jgi:IS1 family transposase